uniref:Uncharacterized protein n=1 Tax=Romanomermis culicivorax TaxID=13658 RepID=A0A915JPH0_ROMCU
MQNWIEAVDLGLQERWITSFALSMALFSFARLLRDYLGPDQNKLLLAIGSDRLTTWFQRALEKNIRLWEYT